MALHSHFRVMSYDTKMVMSLLCTWVLNLVYYSTVPGVAEFAASFKNVSGNYE